MVKRFVKFSRIFLELVFILIFLSFFNNPSIDFNFLLRIFFLTILIILIFILAKVFFVREGINNPLDLNLVFFIIFSFAQTIKNISIVTGINPSLYEIIHYFSILFILFYNLKRKRIIETGLILFLIQSFRIFDLSLVENEFVLINALTLVLASIWLETIIEDDSLRSIKNPLFLPIIIFLLIGVISSLRGVSPFGSLGQLLVIINFAFISFLIANYIRERWQVEHLIFTFFLLAGVLILLCSYNFLFYCLRFGLTRTLNGIRIHIGKIHPNSIAGYFVPMLCISLAIISQYKSKIIKSCLWVISIFMFIILLLTYSRLGGVSFLFAVLTLLILKVLYSNMGIYGNRLLITLAIIFLFIVTLIPFRQAIFSRILDFNSRNVTYYSCRVSLDAFRDNPLLGIGIDNYYLLSKYVKKPIFYYGRYDLQKMRQYIAGPTHSLFLAIALGMGIIGLGVFIWLLASFFKYNLYLLKKIDDRFSKELIMGIFAGVIAIVIHSILAMTFHLTMLPAFFWVLIGVTMSIGTKRNISIERKEKFANWKTIFSNITIIFISIFFILIPIAAERKYQEGIEFRKNREFNNAIRSLNLSKRMVPFNPRYYQELAETLLQRNQIDDAIKLYQSVLRFKKDFAPYYVRLGWLYWYKGMPAYTLVNFEKAIEVDGYGNLGGEHYSDLALIYAALGMQEEAITQFKEAIKIDPAIVNANFWQEFKLSDGTMLLNKKNIYLEKALDKAYKEYLEIANKDFYLAQMILDNIRIAYKFLGKNFQYTQ